MNEQFTDAEVERLAEGLYLSQFHSEQRSFAQSFAHLGRSKKGYMMMARFILTRETGLVAQIEQLKEKAWKYDELCK